jgi:hypothetical protein
MKHLTNIRILGRGIAVILTLALFAALTLGQNLVVSGSGTFSGSGVINVRGNINTVGASAAVSIPGTVTLDGTALQQLGATGSANALTFSTLQALGTSAKQMDVNVTVSDALVVNIPGQNVDLQATRLMLGGTSTLTSGSLDVSDAGCSVVYNSNSPAQTILGLNYAGMVTLSGTAIKNLSADASVDSTFSHSDGDLIVNHNLTVSSSAPTFAAIADVTGNSTLALSGTGAKIINAINGIAAGSAISNTGTGGLLTVQTLAGNSGIINGGTGGVTFALAATNGGDITGGAGAVTFSNTLAQSAGIITAGGGGAVFDGVPTISGGSITAGDGASLDFNTSIANNGTISLTGTGSATFNDNFTSVGTLNFASGSQVTFDGAAQTIPIAIYGNLTADGSGLKTAAGAMTLAGNLVLNQNLDMLANNGTLTFSSAGTVTGNSEVIGAVQRTHDFAAGTAYAFNRSEVTMQFAALQTEDVTIDMRPGVTPSGVGANHVNRYYGILSTANLAAINANMQLYYLNSERDGSLNETRYGLNKYDGSILTKLGSNGGGYTRDTSANIIALSNVNQGLSGISQLAITPIGFFTIASGGWNAIPTWGSTADDIPGATDEATIMATHAVTVPVASTIDSLTISATGSLAVSGNTFNARVISNSGAITVANTLALTGILTNQIPGSSVEITGIGSLTAVTNNGGFTVQNGGVANLTGAFINNSSLTTVGTGALTITGADLTNAGTITNAGSITVQ